MVLTKQKERLQLSYYFAFNWTMIKRHIVG